MSSTKVALKVSQAREIAWVSNGRAPDFDVALPLWVSAAGVMAYDVLTVIM